MVKYPSLLFITIFTLTSCAKNSSEPKPEQQETPVIKSTVFFASVDSLLYSVDLEKGSINWTSKLGNVSVSSPTYSDNIIYIGNRDSSIYAIDATNGSFKWRFKTNGVISSSPIVNNKKLFFGSMDGYTYALDAITGTLIWKLKVGEKAYGSPSINNNLLYISAESVNGTNRFVFVAIDATTGLEKWRSVSPSIYADCRLKQSIVFYGNSNKLIASDAVTGRFIWEFSATRSIFTNPIVSDSLVIASSDSLYALHWQSGKQIWSFGNGQLSGLSPIKADSLIIHAYAPGSLSAIRLFDGSLKWQIIITGRFNTNPTVAETLIFIGSNDYLLYAFDEITGAVKWKLKTGNEISSSACVVSKTGEVFHSSEAGY